MCFLSEPSLTCCVPVPGTTSTWWMRTTRALMSPEPVFTQLRSSRVWSTCTRRGSSTEIWNQKTCCSITMVIIMSITWQIAVIRVWLLADGFFMWSNRERAYLWPGSRCGAKRWKNIDQRLRWDTRWESNTSYLKVSSHCYLIRTYISFVTDLRWFLQGTCLQRCWKEKSTTPRSTTTLWGWRCLSSWRPRTRSGSGGRKWVALYHLRKKNYWTPILLTLNKGCVVAQGRLR